MHFSPYPHFSFLVTGFLLWGWPWNFDASKVRKLHVEVLAICTCDMNLEGAVRRCSLRNAFQCFFNCCTKFHRIFLYRKSVSLKMCYDLLIFNVKGWERASIFSLTFYLENCVSSCILTLMELRDVFRSLSDFKLGGGSWIIGPRLFAILWVYNTSHEI